MICERAYQCVGPAQATSAHPAAPVHITLRVKDKERVEAFYQAALAAGGKDNGAPGPRPEHNPNYYACFVLEPDGRNLEVMLD